MLLVTHNNTFHADDVFSAAVLKLIHPFASMKRTRDEKYFNLGDIIFDVGGKNDGIKFFDHHQFEKAGNREDGYPYASFGLIWKKYGIILCNDQEIVDRIDNNFVKYIDAIDSGYNPNNMDLVISISEIIGLFNNNWNETINNDKQFNKAVKIAKEIIIRKIKKEKSILISKDIINKAIQKSGNEIVILDSYCNWQEEIIKTNKLIIIYPESSGDKWMVRMIPKELNSFENRILLPEDLRGKTQEELFSLTGISDFIFCHTSGFIASTKTKESAIKIAEITLKKNL